MRIFVKVFLEKVSLPKSLIARPNVSLTLVFFNIIPVIYDRAAYFTAWEAFYMWRVKRFAEEI